LTGDSSCLFTAPTWAEGSDIIGGTGTRNITINGFKLQATSNRVDLVYVAPYFTNTFNGIHLTVESNVTIINCQMIDFCPRASNRWNLTTAPNGIRLGGAMANVLVQNNLITNTGNGIVCYPQAGVSTNIQILNNAVWNCSWGIYCESASDGALFYNTKIGHNRINNGIGWDSGSPSPFHQDGIIVGTPNISSNINMEIYGNWIGPLCGYESTTAAIYYETIIDQKQNIGGKIYNNIISMDPGQVWNTHAIAWNGTNTDIENNTIDYYGVALHPASGTTMSTVLNNLILNADTRYFIDPGFTTNCATTRRNSSTLDYCVVMNGHYWWNPGSYTYTDYTTAPGSPIFCAPGYDAHSFNRATFPLGPGYYPAITDTNIVGLGTNLTATFTTDFYGNPRPATARWTIGAVEPANFSFIAINRAIVNKIIWP
jgi:hypothetical protein